MSGIRDNCYCQKGNLHVAVTNIGDRFAEDVYLPFIVAFQYHGTGVLASIKKTVLIHRYYSISQKKKYEQAFPPLNRR
jgi:hypothetical protein